MNASEMYNSEKIKILFFHFDLGNGGAERVLVNLLNKLDPDKYEITLKTIFSGPKKNALHKNIRFQPFFNCNAKRGTSKIFRLLPPSFLYNLFIKENYDIEISFLEQIPTRILGGKKKKETKKFAWIHNTTQSTLDLIGGIFKSKKEFNRIYQNFDKLAFVSKTSLSSFEKFYDIKVRKEVVHNVNDFDKINKLSDFPIDIQLNINKINLCSVGRLCGQKGYDRLISVLGELNSEGFQNWNLFLIGNGPELEALKNLAKQYNIGDKVKFLGFQDNPYKYLSKMDLFVCSSIKEGFSTAVTESVFLGIPVITTDCAGMEEILDNGDIGIIVPNSNDGLKKGLKKLMREPHIIKELKNKTIIKSSTLKSESCLREFEDFISS